MNNKYTLHTNSLVIENSGGIFNTTKCLKNSFVERDPVLFLDVMVFFYSLQYGRARFQKSSLLLSGLPQKPRKDGNFNRCDNRSGITCTHKLLEDLPTELHQIVRHRIKWGTIAPPPGRPLLSEVGLTLRRKFFFSEEVATKVFVRKKLLLTGNQLEARWIH